MSNLGAYQWITTVSKKVGGPVNLLLLTGAAGAAAGITVYKCGETVIKKCVKAVKTRKIDKTPTENERSLYRVNESSVSNEGLNLNAGDQFYILETDGDAVLIEKIGDDNNPYFVSAELLHNISDYKEKTT
jgi:hypothetical protein